MVQFNDNKAHFATISYYLRLKSERIFRGYSVALPLCRYLLEMYLLYKLYTYFYVDKTATHTRWKLAGSLPYGVWLNAWRSASFSIDWLSQYSCVDSTELLGAHWCVSSNYFKLGMSIVSCSFQRPKVATCTLLRLHFIAILIQDKLYSTNSIVFCWIFR